MAGVRRLISDDGGKLAMLELVVIFGLADSAAQLNRLKWVGVVELFEASELVGSLSHHPKVVCQVTGAQSGTGVEKDTEFGVSRYAQAKANMRKAIVNADWHGAEGGADISMMLAGADKQREIADTFCRRGG